MWNRARHASNDGFKMAQSDIKIDVTQMSTSLTHRTSRYSKEVGTLVSSEGQLIVRYKVADTIFRI